MKNFTLLLFLGISLNIFSQDVPLIKVGDDKIGIAKLDLEIQIVGNIVTTTYDMKFYNPTNSILEGELVFPLGENQSVSRFALDANGKIREAVVVEKEQGRIAFEAVVRRRVDPALLEKGTGNNYRARIYPIPAKGYKQIIIAFEEELEYNGQFHEYVLDQSFKNKLETYNVSFKLLNQKAKPEIISKAKLDQNISFNGKDYEFQINKSNYTPNEKIVIKIPFSDEIKINRFNEFVYVYKTLNNELMKKEHPKKIKLLWDTSLSMKGRDLEKEFQYLEAYFNEFKNVKVELNIFSNTLILAENYSVRKGNWDMLKIILRNSIYDGGTSYNALLNCKRDIDEVLLFTDGMYNLSDFPKKSIKPVYVINSMKSSNHSGNKQLATSGQGNYINLNELSVEEAITKTITLPLKFMGYYTDNDSLELYPKAGTIVNKDFSITAKGVKENQTIELKFGYGNTNVKSINVSIPESNNGTNQIENIWAKAKINELQKDSDKNIEEIVFLGKKYGIITNHTSLIVLEDVYDYIKYDITPPEELLAEYLKIKETNTSISVVSENVQQEEITSEDKEEEIQNVTSIIAPTGSEVSISGVVNDQSGLPLPGVNIIIDGTSNGTQSDFDGNYSVNVSPGQVLVYSYVGFKTLETTVQNSGRINIKMEEDAAQLNEVVVTGFGVKKEKKALGYSVQSIEEKSIENSPEPDLTRILSGKAAGVEVTTQNGLSGSSNKVIIRGMNSFSGNNNALYVIDGVPYSNDTNSVGSFINGNMGSSRSLDIDPNNIENIQILKGLAATTLYGSEGRNGVILITTKTSSIGSNDNHINNLIESEEERKRIELRKVRNKLFSEKTVEEKGYTTVYLSELNKIKNKNELYTAYLNQRDTYAHHPAYFVDMYDFFKKNDKEIANRILSNIAEIDNDNYELLKVLAYKLEEQGNYELAVFIYRQILKLRTEDVQSYRDLALALQEIGEFTEALALLNSIAGGKITKGNQRRKFDGVESIAINELRNLIHKDKATYSLGELPNEVYSNYDMDIRVVIDWNHNDTDIDLHIVNPYLEVCSYENTKTKTGGELSEDMTQGFGPEEFNQKFASKGPYYLKVDYYGDRYQKIETPTFLKVTIFKNYGRNNQEKEVKVIRLSGKEGMKLIDRISVL